MFGKQELTIDAVNAVINSYFYRKDKNNENSTVSNTLNFFKVQMSAINISENQSVGNILRTLNNDQLSCLVALILNFSTLFDNEAIASKITREDIEKSKDRLFIDFSGVEMLVDFILHECDRRG